MSEQHTQARGLSVRGTLLGWRVGLSVAVVLLFSVLRGMPPTLVEWPYAHWLINYDFGFVKRGFVGEVAQTLGLALDPQHATQTLNTLAWVIFGVLVLALIAVGVRMLHRTQRAPLVVMLLVLFFASGFMVMAANLIGYYDHIWQIGTILTVWLILRRHLMAAGLTQMVWVLVHESYLMSGYPIVVFALGLAWIQRAQPQPMARARFAFALLAPLMAFVGVFLAHDVQNSSVLSQQLLTRLGEYDALSDVFTPFFVKAYMYRFTDYLIGESQYLLLRVFSMQNWLNTLPFIGFTLYALAQMFKGQRSLKHGLVVSMVIFSPLALHLIAWDYNRIWMYTVWHAFLVVWVLTEFYQAAPVTDRAAPLWFSAALVCMVVVPILPQATSRENLRILPLRLAVVTLVSAILFAPLPAWRIKKASLTETPHTTRSPAQD